MFSLDSLVPWLLQSPPSPHPCLREALSHFSFKAACCPRLGQSWESQRAHRLVAEQCPGGDVPAASPSSAPRAAEHRRRAELAQPCFPRRGKNGEIEVRISSLFHESHGRSNQARAERSSARACGQKQLPACAGCCHSCCKARGPGLEAQIQRKAVKELGTGALCLAFALTRRHACSPEGQQWSQVWVE